MTQRATTEVDKRRLAFDTVPVTLYLTLPYQVAGYVQRNLFTMLILFDSLFIVPYTLTSLSTNRLIYLVECACTP
jgi:hypothetical protein